MALYKFYSYLILFLDVIVNNVNTFIFHLSCICLVDLTRCRQLWFDYKVFRKSQGYQFL